MELPELIALLSSHRLPLCFLTFACTVVFLLTLCGKLKVSAEQKRKHEQFAQEMRRIQGLHITLERKNADRHGKRPGDLQKTTSSKKAKSRKCAPKQKARSSGKWQQRKSHELREKSSTPPSESRTVSSKSSSKKKPKRSRHPRKKKKTEGEAAEQAKVKDDDEMKKVTAEPDDQKGKQQPRKKKPTLRYVRAPTQLRKTIVKAAEKELFGFESEEQTTEENDEQEKAE